MKKEFIASLKKEIKTIQDEITEILYFEDVFRNRAKSLLSDPNVDGYVKDTLVKNHYSSILIAIRRQLGEFTNEVSLLRLLQKLREHPTLITEDWYAAEWLDESSLLNQAKESNDGLLENFVRGIPVSEFQTNFGIKGHLDEKLLEADIESLKSATDKIKQYVDKKLAHTDKTSPERVTEQDYFKALKVLEDLTRKYILLLEQVGMPNLTPVIQD